MLDPTTSERLVPRVMWSNVCYSPHVRAVRDVTAEGAPLLSASLGDGPRAVERSPPFGVVTFAAQNCRRDGQSAVR